MSEDKLRISGSLYRQFNSFSRPILWVSGGRSLSQINENNPITPLVNSISTLFFENNYAKFFDNTFAKITYSKEVFNGLRLGTGISYSRRKPVYNTTDYVFINDNDKQYTSNNPLLPNSAVPVIKKHDITKAKFSAS